MRHLRNLSVLGVILLSIQVFPAEAAEPISLHPENPHYFSWRGEPTILVTSGEHYGALLSLDFDYVRYFDAIKRHGLATSRPETFGSVRTFPRLPVSGAHVPNPGRRILG